MPNAPEKPTEPADEPGAPIDDVKEKFRQALAAKSKRDHDHIDDRPDQRFDTHDAAGGRRMFRRKSGS